jgi:hypothetical protein
MRRGCGADGRTTSTGTHHDDAALKQLPEFPLTRDVTTRKCRRVVDFP